MAMEDVIQNWDTWQFTQLAQDTRIPPPDGWWLNTFYTTPFFSEKKTIVFEEFPGFDRRLAPYVMPNLQGRVMREPGPAGLKSFEPAYLKPKHNVDPSMTIPRQPGEPLGGNLSLQERFDRITASRYLSQRAMIQRRWDWMGAQSLIYGVCDIVGEDYTPVRINFGRDGALEDTLTSTARWGETDAEPLADVQRMRAAGRSFGNAPINNVIFGPNAWKNFIADPAVKELMSLQVRQVIRANIDLSGMTLDGTPVQSVGTFTLLDGSSVSFWTYENRYLDPFTGQLFDVLDTDDVVGIGGAVNCVRAFGAIQDFDAGLQATDIFAKQWVDKDPSTCWVVSQSAPLMVPININNTFRLQTR